ncbi:hypothetical protein [Haliscomenobacter sp.]
MKSIDTNIDAAYLKLVAKMPNWIPGRQRGMPTRTVMNLPIRIRIE